MLKLRMVSRPLQFVALGLLIGLAACSDAGHPPPRGPESSPPTRPTSTLVLPTVTATETPTYDSIKDQQVLMTYPELGNRRLTQEFTIGPDNFPLEVYNYLPENTLDPERLQEWISHMDGMNGNLTVPLDVGDKKQDFSLVSRTVQGGIKKHVFVIGQQGNLPPPNGLQVPTGTTLIEDSGTVLTFVLLPNFGPSDNAVANYNRMNATTGALFFARHALIPRGPVSAPNPLVAYQGMLMLSKQYGVAATDRVSNKTGDKLQSDLMSLRFGIGRPPSFLFPLSHFGSMPGNNFFNTLQ